MMLEERDEKVSNSNPHNHAGQFIRLRNKLSELEDMETSQILEELKISDGGYTEDCFSVLSKRLVEFPEDTLCILNHNKLMADTDFEALVITGIGAELPYIGAAEEKAVFIFIAIVVCALWAFEFRIAAVVVLLIDYIFDFITRRCPFCGKHFSIVLTVKDRCPFCGKLFE